MYTYGDGFFSKDKIDENGNERKMIVIPTFKQNSDEP